MNTDFARNQMVQQQVRAWDVFDEKVLDVLRAVPREAFVAPEFADLAFAELELPIGHGECMMTPTHEGRLLQSLDLEAGNRVLEIGTGNGFVTACLANLADSVVSLDIHADFIEQAGARLEAQGITNVELIEADGTKDLPAGPFDAVAVTGSLENFDPRFIEALADGGRLFVVVGDAPAMEARKVTRTSATDWHSEALFETVLKPLVNGRKPVQFAF